jgi:uncharacterized damage-inducible protein DinB
MQPQDVRLLFDYNAWANQRLLARAAQVTPQQWQAPTSHSFGSLHSTLLHILDTEYGWRCLLEGKGPTPILAEEDYPAHEALAARWREEEAAWDTFLTGLPPADLLNPAPAAADDETQPAHSLWLYMFHVVNHGMQHRSEAAAMLTTYGEPPGDIDFTVFLDERAG